MLPQYFLSAHSYCCELEDGAIILDLTTGSYIGVHAESLLELRVRVLNWPNSCELDRDAVPSTKATSGRLIADLLSRGILTTSPTPERTPIAPHTLGTLTIHEFTAERRWAPITHIPQFAMALAAVIMRHKDKRLRSLLEWLRQRQYAISREGPAATRKNAVTPLASFFRLRIWFYTADRRCLFDSLVLATFLTRQMIPCTFVIGVSTKPFLAHSWVQMGELVLNDTAEHVQMFTPILAIGG